MPSSFDSSQEPNLKGSGLKVDGRWDNWLLEVRFSLNTVRDLRAALSTITLAAHANPQMKVACALVSSRLTPSRLSSEVAMHKATIHQDIAMRLWIAKVDKDGQAQREDLPFPQGWLQDTIARKMDASVHCAWWVSICRFEPPHAVLAPANPAPDD